MGVVIVGVVVVVIVAIVGVGFVIIVATSHIPHVHEYPHCRRANPEDQPLARQGEDREWVER